MNMEALVVIEPALHFGMFVGSIVVTADVDLVARRGALFDQPQELQPFGVTMTLGTLPDHFPRQNVERRKQRRDAITLAVVGHGRVSTALDR